MNKNDKLDKYFTMPQALTALGYPVNYRTVMYRAIKRKILSEPVRIAGCVLFLRDEVLELYKHTVLRECRDVNSTLAVGEVSRLTRIPVEDVCTRYVSETSDLESVPVTEVISIIERRLKDYEESLPESELRLGDVMSIRDACKAIGMSHETLYKYSTLGDEDAPIQHGTFCGDGGFFVRSSVEQFKRDRNKQ